MEISERGGKGRKKAEERKERGRKEERWRERRLGDTKVCH